MELLEEAGWRKQKPKKVGRVKLHFFFNLICRGGHLSSLAIENMESVLG